MASGLSTATSSSRLLADVPRDVPWMPPPRTPIAGCPPGLEYLTAVDQILVRQQIVVLEG